MKFKVEHVFRGISLADYEALYLDEPFNIAVCKDVELDREVVKRELKGKHLTRVVKCAPRREIPGPAAAIIGASKLEYTEYLEYDMGSNKGTWKTVSGILSDKIESAGTFSFAQKGGGVARILEGEVKVKIFGLGGVVEKFIVSDVEKSYDKVATFTQKWIDKGGKV
jgi:hypothetical protein